MCLFCALLLGKVGTWFVCRSVVWEGISCNVDAGQARRCVGLCQCQQLLLGALLCVGLLIRGSWLFGLVGRGFGRYSENFLQGCFALAGRCVDLISACCVFCILFCARGALGCSHCYDCIGRRFVARASASRTCRTAEKPPS